MALMLLILHLESIQDDTLPAKVLHKLVHIVLWLSIVRREAIHNVLLLFIVRSETIQMAHLPPIVRLKSFQPVTLAAGGPFAPFCLAS